MLSISARPSMRSAFDTRSLEQSQRKRACRSLITRMSCAGNRAANSASTLSAPRSSGAPSSMAGAASRHVVSSSGPALGIRCSSIPRERVASVASTSRLSICSDVVR
jgi:hypothetical protein